MNPGAKVGPPRTERLRLIFAGIFGCFLGLSLLKFGNPPIFETLVNAPEDVYGFLLGFPWPISWAYGLLAMVAVLGFCNARLELRAPWWLVALPLIWLVWQIVAGTQSVDAQLTNPTLKHFGACVVCFYLGYFSLVRVPKLWPFWLGLVCGFLLVLTEGWEQRFGGLQQTRAYFFTYLYPKMETVSPEFLKKMSSDRIFSSLFYPNALAGVILLLLPMTLAVVWQARQRLTQPARKFLGIVIAVGALGCLYWSGSKSGWLLMLCLALITLLRLPWRKSLKVGLVAALLLLGLTGFFLKYAKFFQKGATSVSARFDYWSAAVQTARAHPLFGTGPGTFAIPYHRIKRPESEMARLAHNDYLEQASDSGVPGFALYTIFIAASIVRSFPRRISESGDRRSISQPEAQDQEWLMFSVWLGLVGWSLQGLVEFGLYIPALAWPAFALMGWLIARTPCRNLDVQLAG
jgi:O-antigen ligase